MLRNIVTQPRHKQRVFMNRWCTLLLKFLLLAFLLSGCAVLAPAKKEAEYEQIVTVLRPIDKVPITINFEEGMFYHVQVQNALPGAISLVWDESSYVNTRRESIRLIRIPDRGNLPLYPRPKQADSPIAPDSQLQADFMGESWIELARSGAIPRPKDGFKKARIYLVFNIKGKRVDWQGEVTFVTKKSKPN